MSNGVIEIYFGCILMFLNRRYEYKKNAVKYLKDYTHGMELFSL